MKSIKFLQSKGFKVTKQRKTILDVLTEQSEKLLNVDELYQLLPDEIDLSTLYRNLDLFEEISLLEKQILDGKGYYRLKCLDDHHHHLICLRCNKVIHLDYCPLNELKTLAEQENFLLTDHRVELYGICKECQTKG